MLTNLGITYDEHRERVVAPLPMSAVYNKQQFISQFVSLHHERTQPTLVSQLLTNPLANTFAEFWVLYDDFHQPIACCAANTAMSDCSVGYVGLFEAKTVKAGTDVLRAATEWLRRGGIRQFEPVRQVLGPVNMTTWLQYRLRVDIQPQPSMSYEPRHPAFYQECFAEAGYVKAVDYYTTFFHIDQLLHGYQRYTLEESLDVHGLVMQPWNTLDLAASLTPERYPGLTHEDNVAKRIYNLTLELFRGKELFDVGVTRQNHRQLVLNDMISRPEVDNASLMDLSSFVTNPITGEDVGYLACWKESDNLIIKTVGFVPKVRKTKIFAIAVLETIKRAKNIWGCTGAACALMNEASAGLSEHVGGDAIRHVYRLYAHLPSTPASAIHPPHAAAQAEQKEHSLENHVQLNGRVSAVDPHPLPGHLQSHQQNLRLQQHLAQQRMRYMAQRSKGRAMARL